MFLKFHAALIGTVCAAVFMAGASSANAQVNSDFSAVLDGGDPTLNGLFFNSGQPCDLTPSAGIRYYETKTITVTTAGMYTLLDQFDPVDAGLGIYSGTFNPASPATNCVTSSEDGFSATLAAGTYTIVLTSLGTNTFGNVTYRLRGPAAVNLGAAPAAVPTLSEWAMILFGLILAGGAALYIQRRQIAV